MDLFWARYGPAHFFRVKAPRLFIVRSELGLKNGPVLGQIWAGPLFFEQRGSRLFVVCSKLGFQKHMGLFLARYGPVRAGPPLVSTFYTLVEKSLECFRFSREFNYGGYSVNFQSHIHRKREEGWMVIQLTCVN